MTTEYPKGEQLFFKTYKELNMLKFAFLRKEAEYTHLSIERAEKKLYHISYLYTSLARSIRDSILPLIEDNIKLIKYPFPIINLGNNHHLYLSQQITLFAQYRFIVLREIENEIAKQERSIFETNCKEQDLAELDEIEHIINRTFDKSTIELSFQGIIHRDDVLSSSNNAFAVILTPEEIDEVNNDDIAHELLQGINRINEIKQNRKDAGMRR